MAEMLSSRENTTIKLCRKLSSSAKERKKNGLFLAEGARLCCDAAKAGIEIDLLLFTSEAEQRYEEQLICIKAKAARAWKITPELAEYLADTKATQGIFCLCLSKQPKPLELETGGRYLLLDHLQDPGNLGTIIRGAEAFGISAVVLSEDCPDLYSPKVLRSTMGSAFRQPVFTTQNMSELIDAMSLHGIATYAAALDKSSITARMLPRKGGLAIVVGNEGNGVSEQVQRACGATVYIPMTEQIESLNAAAAATVLMWEMTQA